MDKQTILLVDDEINILKSLKRLFIDTDYKIYIAESADAGLLVLQEETINLVISDHKMPHKNGVQFLKEVKERYPNTIRMILSGFADVAAIVESINEGNVYKFLAKPWNDQDLLTTVIRALEHFELQSLNNKLVENLQYSNNELLKLTESLEETVAKRTADLEIKNKALKISQYILNLLPVGVFGVDSDGIVVYVNELASKYLTKFNIALSSSLKGNETEIGKHLNLYLERNETRQITYKMDNQTNSLITPLIDGAGFIVVLFKNNENISMINIEHYLEVENG